MEQTAEAPSAASSEISPERRLRGRPALRIVDDESKQVHSTRKALFRRLQRLLGMPVLTYFTSFHQAGGIVEASDGDILEALLQGIDTENGLALVINSSDDIAIKALASDMLAAMPEEEIKARIRLFLEPSTKKVHGRAIHRDEAAACGLKVDFWEVDQIRWKSLYELYTRTQQFLFGREASKCMETATDAWCTL